MKYYYIAPETEIDTLFSTGVIAKGKPEITIIALNDNFLMSKFIFDVYAYEILGVDVYCAFEIMKEGLETALFNSPIHNTFAEVYKVIYQPHIDKKFLKTIKSDHTYEGMGFIEGVFPVENRDRFTDEYKNKILEYIRELGEM